MSDDRRWIRNAQRRINRGGYYITYTDPCSRHVRSMADALTRYGEYPMLREEPLHCAVSMLATVEALWAARKEVARLKAVVSKGEGR